MINKALAAGITLAFMSLVRPDTPPSAVGASVVALLMYEGLRWSIEYIQKVRRKKKEARYITVSLGDIRRWADTWMEPYPFKEVS